MLHTTTTHTTSVFGHDDNSINNNTFVNPTTTTAAVMTNGGNDDPSSFISDDVAFYFEITFWVFVNALVSLLGTVANIVNIVVYVKMGMEDVVNISLLGLAVSDLISVSSIVWMGICYGLILLDPPGILFDPMTFMYVTSGWPHLIFSRVSCYITAMVSVERCLCVIVPFKVNRLITPTRIKACLVFIFLAFPSAFIPTLVEHRMAWKVDPTHNETRYMADFTDRRQEVQANSYYAVGILFPTLSFLIVSVCVVVTNRYLLRKMEWKKENTQSTPTSVATTTVPNSGVSNNVTESNNSATSNVKGKDTNQSRISKAKTKNGDNSVSMKELKVIQLLTVVCVMFLICYSPSIILNYARLWYPAFGVFGPYHNIAVVIYSFVFLLSVSNSSFNIVFYYVMSTKYRQTLLSMLSRAKV